VTAVDNLYGCLHAGFRSRLDRPFLRLPDATVLTYGDIDELSARVAGALRTRGLAAGDRLVAQVGKSPLAVALYLGCVRAGIVFVPLNEGYTDREVEYFVGDARPRMVVAAPGRDVPHGDAELVTLDQAGGGSLAELVAATPPDHALAPRAGETASMLYTSGTTGKPKGAMLTTGNLVSNGVSLAELWGFRADDVLLHALPIFHVHGLFVALHCAMLRGCAVEFLPRFDLDAVRAALPRSTVMMGVPTFYGRLLGAADFGRDECTSMRLFISGSAPLTESVHQAFEARTGHRILERYGMTETGMITSNPLDGARIAGTVGYPLPDVRVRVADDAGQPLPSGEIGVVEVAGPNVFTGYWGMPDKTAASFRPDGFFITGDLGSLADDGRLTLSGRGTDLIISGGLNIYPKEIELLIDDVDGVVESAVIGVPHPDLGDGVIAVVVADPGFDAGSIRTALDGRLARFKHPKHVAVVDDLPRNAMGKVEKAALRARYAEQFTGVTR
jgi:malonyl-CoA/methylmalonyl-CoA synthetase